MCLSISVARSFFVLTNSFLCQSMILCYFFLPTFERKKSYADMTVSEGDHLSDISLMSRVMLIVLAIYCHDLWDELTC